MKYSWEEIYHDEDLEVDLCVMNGKASIEIWRSGCEDRGNFSIELPNVKTTEDFVLWNWRRYRIMLKKQLIT